MSTPNNSERTVGHSVPWGRALRLGLLATITCWLMIATHAYAAVVLGLASTAVGIAAGLVFLRANPSARRFALARVPR